MEIVRICGHSCKTFDELGQACPQCAAPAPQSATTDTPQVPFNPSDERPETLAQYFTAIARAFEHTRTAVKIIQKKIDTDPMPFPVLVMRDALKRGARFAATGGALVELKTVEDCRPLWSEIVRHYARFAEIEAAGRSALVFCADPTGYQRKYFSPAGGYSFKKWESLGKRVGAVVSTAVGAFATYAAMAAWLAALL